MAYLNTPKDILAEHVKQLLVMDEDRQRAQLAHFSTYAAVKISPTEQMKGDEQSTNIGCVWPEAGSSATTSTYGGSGTASLCGESDSDCEPPHSDDSAESSESEGQTNCPAKIGVPPGLDIDPRLASDVAKQHLMGTCQPCAYSYLKAAKAQTAKQDPLYVPLPPSMPAQITADSLQSTPWRSPVDALTDAFAAQQPSAAALNVLKQAVSDLAGIVPEDEADVAKAAQKFFQAELQRLQAKREFECRQAEAQRHQQEFASAISKQSGQTALHAMTLMQQQLDQISQEMDNITKAQEPTLQQADPTSAPWNLNANCFVPGAGQPAFPAAAVQPVVASFVMPWEDQKAMPVDSRPPGVHLPSGSRPPDVHFPKQFVPPNGRGQGASRPYGAMPATKGATGPGWKGKAAYRQKAVPSAEPLFGLSHPEKVVLVKKIKQLGFESSAALEAHYSQFGKVERVVVPPHRVVVPPHHAHNSSSRLRPSNIGFVVMSEKKEADAILSMGEEQIVGGVVIKAQRFQRPPEADQDNGLDVESL